ncbi:MAG: T9SS type A sorting domain-containing protein [Dysgonamonadaceae bacterium]|jgi:hypothetical protein|nr:T9SS type A sorting domain-containing protein [Dysgonamonadaceae bacterium]
MKRKLIFAVLFSLSISTFAQDVTKTTKEQADAIALDYIQNDVTQDYVLLRNDNPPSKDGKTSVTWNNNSPHAESLNIEYPCWVYLVQNPTVNETWGTLYLFVNKEDGSLLEVKNKQAVNAAPDNWTKVTAETTRIKEADKNSNILITPNPVSDLLNIVSGTKISHIELYDSSGRMLRAESVQNKTNYRLNVSSLPEGWYVLKIFNTAGKQTKVHKLIKN